MKKNTEAILKKYYLLREKKVLSWTSLVILTLVKVGETNMTTIAKLMKTSTATVSMHVEKMYQVGLILRTTRENDRRTKLLALTDEGRELLDVLHHADQLV